MSKIGTIKISVDQSRTGQTLTINSTGRRGAVSLNGINVKVSYNSQSPSSTEIAFWLDVLALAGIAIS